MTSRKELALRSEIQSLKGEIGVLNRQLSESGKSLENLKSSTESTAKIQANSSSDLEDMKRRMALTQSALDEVLARLNTLVKKGGALDEEADGNTVQEEPSQERVAHVEDRLSQVEKNLFALTIAKQALLKRAHPSLEGKAAAPWKGKKKDELTKRLNQLYVDQDLRRVVSATTTLLQDPKQSALWDTATHYRAEAYFAQGAFDLAYFDFQNLITQYPKHPRIPRALLLSGDCLAQLQYISQAKDIFLSVIKEFPTSAEAPAAQNRLTQLSTAP